MTTRTPFTFCVAHVNPFYESYFGRIDLRVEQAPAFLLEGSRGLTELATWQIRIWQTLRLSVCDLWPYGTQDCRDSASKSHSHQRVHRKHAMMRFCFWPLTKNLTCVSDESGGF